MTEDVLDFISALDGYVRAALATMGEPADYCTEAVRIVDARNHLFCMAGKKATDEAENIYALRELCRIDEDTMEMVPDHGRMAAIARNYF